MIVDKKTISISKETRNNLTLLKIKWDLSTIDDVLRKLINEYEKQ